MRFKNDRYGNPGLGKALIIATIGTIMVSCTEISMDSYRPRNLEEFKIIRLLEKYRISRNSFDADRYLSCLHPSGKFSFMGDHILSKSSLEKRLQRFWSQLLSEDATVYPIMRESITGDFFGEWNFYNLRISLIGSTAGVALLCKASWLCRQLHYVTFTKENGKWMISETSWQHF